MTTSLNGCSTAKREEPPVAATTGGSCIQMDTNLFLSDDIISYAFKYFNITNFSPQQHRAHHAGHDLRDRERPPYQLYICLTTPDQSRKCSGKRQDDYQLSEQRYHQRFHSTLKGLIYSLKCNIYPGKYET